MPPSPTPSRLPEERIGSPGQLRLWLLVVGLIAGVFGINSAATDFLAAHGSNHAYRMLAAKYALLDEAAGGEPVDWLILGDSSGAHGINPEVWTDITGGSALNLSVVANLLVNNDVWMLREYIERVGVPKNIVLVHAFDIWYRGYNTALLGKIPREWGYWNTPPQVQVKPAHLHRIALSRYLPTYSESTTLQSAFWRWWSDGRDPYHMEPNGWVRPRAHSPSQLGRDKERALKHAGKKSSLRLSSHNERAMKVLAWVSNQYGVDIFVTHGPMSRAVARTPQFQQFHTQLDETLRESAANAPRVHIVEDLWAPPDRHLEQTVDHPSLEAVEAFTTFTAAVVLESGRQTLNP